MKLVGKLLSLFGVVAGIFYVCHQGIARLYENTIHRYVVFEHKDKNEH